MVYAKDSGHHVWLSGDCLIWLGMNASQDTESVRYGGVGSKSKWCLLAHPASRIQMNKSDEAMSAWVIAMVSEDKTNNRYQESVRRGALGLFCMEKMKRLSPHVRTKTTPTSQEARAIATRLPVFSSKINVELLSTSRSLRYPTGKCRGRMWYLALQLDSRCNFVC